MSTTCNEKRTAVKNVQLSEHDLAASLDNGAVLVTATQRQFQTQMQSYQHRQLANNIGCWETPKIMPYRVWLLSLHATALATGLSQVSVVPNQLAKHQWRQIIEEDDAVFLLDSEGAARTAMQAWELSCAWLEDRESAEAQYLSTDQSAWKRWADKYDTWLVQRESIDESLLADELITILKNASTRQRKALLPHQVMLDGFIQFSTQMQRFFKTLNVFDTETVFLSPPPKAHVVRTSYADEREELFEIARQMRASLEHDTEQSLGLVIHNLENQRINVTRAFEQVFYPAMTPTQIADQPIVYAIESSETLALCPIIDSALRILRLCTDTLDDEFSALLLSAHWAGAQTEIRQREILDRQLRQRRVQSLTAEQLIKELNADSALIPLLENVISSRCTQNATLTQWASRFNQWLRILGWPGDQLVNHMQLEIISAWQECLDDMHLVDQGADVSLDTALKQLKLFTIDRAVEFDMPIAPIQIISSAASHGIAFDCLWIAGMDTDQWPPMASPNPLLPIQSQKKHQIPDSSPSMRLAFAEKEFIMWAAHSSELIVSHAQMRGGHHASAAALPEFDRHTDPLTASQSDAPTVDACAPAFDTAKTIAQAMALEAVTDTHGPRLAPGTKVDGGAYLFENQSACPFRAFVLHRLQVRPLEEIGLGLDARQHGTLLHTALEYFWHDVQSHDRLRSMDSDKLNEVISDVVTRSSRKHQVPTELTLLEHSRLCNLLREWLMECELPRKPFNVVRLESKHRIEHGGIAMDVIIDRVDEVGGKLVAIDYKSGTINSITTWGDDRIAKPQLPLYVLTDERIEAAGYAQIASHKCQFSGVASQSDILPNVSVALSNTRRPKDTYIPITDWRGWREHWRQSLDTIAKELRDGVATVSPTKEACTYCELSPLCRHTPT